MFSGILISWNRASTIRLSDSSDSRFSKTVWTSAQVLLRWAIQWNIPVPPKLCQPERVVEKGHLFDFEISEEDMGRFSALDCGEKYCWDPTQVS